MLKFRKLWNDFPDKIAIKAKCQNKQPKSTKPFSDYCAIMLSETLIKSGVSTSNTKATKCWSHQGARHILLAEEMANWLNKSNIVGLGRLERIPPGTFQKKLKDKTGIIFFKDYWQRGAESVDGRSGDHIDLWNKDEITSSSMFTRGVLEFFGRVSDLNRSREIWFWEIK